MSEVETLFTKIIKREIPADIVYEDDKCISFKNIDPQAPIHVLLVPKIVIPKLSMAAAEHQEILGYLMLKAGDIAHKLGIGNDFRLVVNNGEGVGQSIFHLHLHILGGREFKWPPG